MKKPLQANNLWDGASFPVAVAHRGGDGAGAEKENSLKAFQAAYDRGYRWFETDVVPTKDGKLLAIHGRGLQRRPNKDLPSRLEVQRLTLAEANKTIKVGGEKPLTLDKLLDSFPDTKIFIDPKTYKAAPILADFLISRSHDLNRICVGSFHARNTSLIRKRLKAATNLEITCGAIGAYRGNLLILSARLNFLKPLLKIYINHKKINAFYLPYKKLKGNQGRKIVSLAHSLGLKIAAYTPNDEQSIKDSLASGADVVMSDRAELLAKYIKL